MKTVLIGYGEIGKAVHERFAPYHSITICDIDYQPKGEFEIMLVAIPYTDRFVEIIKDYQQKYKPKAVIIFSTVAIGTTAQIENAVHSPVEGRHPNLAESIDLMPRWVGGYNKIANKFFFDAFMQIKFVKNPDHTEFLKLMSTSKYGVNIEIARYAKSVCDEIGLDYEKVKDFDRDYNELYLSLGLSDYQRYILDPPDGVIKGHCVVPNSKILDEQYPSVFLKEIYKEEGKC